MSEDIPTINLEVYNDLLEILGEDFHELIETFLLNTPPHLTALSTSVNESNFKEIFHTAHFLIGSSGNLGLEKFSNTCNNLCNIDSCIELEKSLHEVFTESKTLIIKKLNNK